MKERPLLEQMYHQMQTGADLEEIKAFTDEFEMLMMYYSAAILEMETKLKILARQLSIENKGNPIESIKTRLKSVSSIQEKLKRKGIGSSCQEIEQGLSDIAGLRVICSYIDDIYLIAEALLRQDDILLIQKKDYIANPKSNGYRSLHLIVEIPIFLVNIKRLVRVEIQLRTIAMEAWANLEHSIKYKNIVTVEKEADINYRLKQCADLSNQLDIEMQQIRNDVKRTD